MSRRKLERYQARVSSLKEKSKLFNTMYTSLEKSEKIYVAKFGKTVKREDGSRVDGRFEPDQGGGSITYKNTSINSQAFIEELFHAYQNDNKDCYATGDFNFEFEAKLSVTAIEVEAGNGIAFIGGMGAIQSRVYNGDYGNENMQITPTNVNSKSFLDSYKIAANAYAKYNKKFSFMNRHYKASTTVSPSSLIKMANKAYGN